MKMPSDPRRYEIKAHKMAADTRNLPPLTYIYKERIDRRQFKKKKYGTNSLGRLERLDHEIVSKSNVFKSRFYFTLASFVLFYGSVKSCIHSNMSGCHVLGQLMGRRDQSRVKGKSSPFLGNRGYGESVDGLQDRREGKRDRPER